MIHDYFIILILKSKKIENICSGNTTSSILDAIKKRPTGTMPGIFHATSFILKVLQKFRYCYLSFLVEKIQAQNA